MSIDPMVPAPVPNMAAGDTQTDWTDQIVARLFLARILLKRFWWVFLITMSAGIGYQSYVGFSKPPVYASSAQMIVSGRLSIPEGLLYSEELSNFFGTQIALMQSSQVKERAAARVLALQPNLKPVGVAINIAQSPDASIFMLNAYGGEPQYTQAYLEATMYEYLAFKREMRADTTDRTFTAINEEVLNLQKKIQETEDEKVEFQKKNNMVFVQEQGTTSGTYLSKLNSQLSECQTQLKIINTMDLESMQASQSDSDVINLESLGVSKEYFDAKDKEDQLKAELAEDKKYMRPDHPRLEELQREIDDLDNNLQIYRRESTTRLQERKKSLEAQIKSLQAVIDEQEVYALDYSRRMAEYERISSRLDRQKRVLDQLLSSVQSINLNMNLEQESVGILENATPAVAVRENVWGKIGSGAGIGFIMGVSILAAIAVFDRRIVTVDDISQRFEDPVMGMIPFQKTTNGVVEPLKVNDSRVMLAEACRSLRSSLLYSSHITGTEKSVREIVVTSSVPGEGKSTVSMNLAVTLALTSAKTLLIDADLRRGHLHKLLGLTRNVGLTEVLEEKVSVEQAVQKTEIPFLDFMACGAYPAHPGELLISAVSDNMIKEIRKRYEYIVIDTAPVLATDDTVGFATKMDRVLFIMRSGHTRVKEAQLSLQNLFFRHVKVSGIVLNGVDTHGPGAYYYRYQDYYGRADKGSRLFGAQSNPPISGQKPEL